MVNFEEKFNDLIHKKIINDISKTGSYQNQL